MQHLLGVLIENWRVLINVKFVRRTYSHVPNGKSNEKKLNIEILRSRGGVIILNYQVVFSTYVNVHLQ